MGKLKNIEIFFDNNKNVYYPGDCISGNIMVESRGEIKINTLKVYIRGIAKVHWTETKTAGYRLGNYTEHYRSEIEYISLKQTLIGGKESTKINSHLKEHVCAGSSIFPFSFVLPRTGIVTSFEGKHGSIRYYLKAELDKPWTLNHKIKKLFTVITPIDINEREYLIPVCNEASKYYCCWFCRSGPISLNVKTDRRGYCPGESIVLNALFENSGNRSVLPQASLYQCQTFNASSKHVVATNKIASLTGTSISSKSFGEWDSKLLKIPAVSPSINSVLIRVDYFVKISLFIPGSYSLTCVLPIVIGTVPYRRNQSASAVSHLMPSQIQMNARIDAPPAYSELTPNHAVSSTGDPDDNDDQLIKDTNYCPLYTYVSDYIAPPPYSEFEIDYKTSNRASNNS